MVVETLPKTTYFQRVNSDILTDTQLLKSPVFQRIERLSFISPLCHELTLFGQALHKKAVLELGSLGKEDQHKTIAVLGREIASLYGSNVKKEGEKEWIIDAEAFKQMSESEQFLVAWIEREKAILREWRGEKEEKLIDEVEVFNIETHTKAVTI